MAWKQESWADIVARAASVDPHGRRALVEVESAESLAARAERWLFSQPHLAVREDGVTLGTAMESIDVSLAQLYHVEPVDPWPSLAIGWVDRGTSYRAVMTPHEQRDDVHAFAAAVEELVTTHARTLRAVVPGWTRAPVLAWERVEALPGERDEKPALQGYRMAPRVEDPIVARRVTAPGEGSLWTWLWSRFASPPRRIDPREIVLTQRFVYVRTRSGARLRLPLAALRTSWRTATGDAIHVFGRNTEMLLVHQDGCEVAAALDATLAARA